MFKILIWIKNFIIFVIQLSPECFGYVVQHVLIPFVVCFAHSAVTCFTANVIKHTLHTFTLQVQVVALY